MKEIEIPFGAKDSELKGWEYTIPEGMEAEIKDGKIVVREKESEDERIINQLITLVDSTGEVLLIPTNKEELIAWLKKQKESLHISETCKENADSFTDEDERIRKELVNFLQSPFIKENLTDEKVAPWVAYLEKQKENPKSADSIPSDCMSDAKCEDRSPKHSDSDGTDIRDTPAYWKGWDDAMKQKEQKHPNGCFTCDEYKKGYESGRSNGFTAGYNKAMKEIDQKEQKPNVEICPHSIRSKSYKENGYPIEDCVQKPAEWSEEDEEMLEYIIGDVNDAKQLYTTQEAKDMADKEIAWLKSLRPSWKPSEEQMRASEPVEWNPGWKDCTGN